MTDMNPARDADLPEVEAFLADHAPTSMLLRANLRRYGLGDRRSPRAVSLVLLRDDGRITGLLGMTNAGFAMLQAPMAGGDEWQDLARWLGGRRLAGLTGESGQAAALIAALGLPESAFLHRATEPLYHLDLAALDLSTLAPGTIRRPRERDRDLLTAWYTGFEASALNTPPALAAERGADRADLAIDGDHVRLFERDETPLAMTAFNAELPEIVQVGGVYTPPEGRNRRAARSAVGLHLAEARRYGVRQAVLAAASPAACRSYETLGFRPVGQMTLALLHAPAGAAP
ncbi:GNAT family N-acetyltransferase [Pararhodobacter sp.]|uniref:GNAT family N-acetyltransferase n=1 Tax=Pararhodobacter sp. TaxID=2127056 RepID=UPI002FE1DEA1